MYAFGKIRRTYYILVYLLCLYHVYKIRIEVYILQLYYSIITYCICVYMSIYIIVLK